MLNKRDTIKQAHPKDKEINLKNFHASQTVSFEDLKKQRAMTFEGKKQIIFVWRQQNKSDHQQTNQTDTLGKKGEYIQRKLVVMTL